MRDCDGCGSEHGKGNCSCKGMGISMGMKWNIANTSTAAVYTEPLAKYGLLFGTGTLVLCYRRRDNTYSSRYVFIGQNHNRIVAMSLPADVRAEGGVHDKTRCSWRFIYTYRTTGR